MSQINTDPNIAAEKLRQAGIPGIKYLSNQGSRGGGGGGGGGGADHAGGGGGTSNYVVFDPKTIDIIKKYGLAALLGGGAAANAPSSQDQTVAQ